MQLSPDYRLKRIITSYNEKTSWHMEKDRITAHTLAEILELIRHKNEQDAGSGYLLFEKAYEAAKLLRASALDESRDKLGVSIREI